MKILRTTMYSPDLEPITVVAREIDLTVSLEEAAKPQPGLPVVNDIFEMEGEPSIVEATVVAAQRQEAAHEEESNLAIYYYWNGQQLGRIARSGALANPAPAPMSGELLKSAMEQLALHPHYRGQMVLSNSIDGTRLTLIDGEVKAS